MYGSQRDDAGTDMIYISGEKENGEVRLDKVNCWGKDTQRDLVEAMGRGDTSLAY